MRGSGDRTQPEGAARLRRSFKDAKEASIERFEREYLAALLLRNRFSLSAAAREADVDRKHLRKLVRKYALMPDSGKEDEE